MTVSLQSYFSRKINLTAKQTVWVAPLLAIGIIVPWFITLHYISLFSAYVYLVILP
ncbi:putative transport system permease [Actinobacillus equuli]|nr:putative transport system permease [Actinobacillus equuli]